MNHMQKLLMLVSCDFLTAAKAMSVDELEIAFPQFSWSAGVKERAEVMYKILEHERAGYLLPQVSAQADLLVQLYHWCMEYHGRFTLQDSYQRFIEQAHRYKWESVLSELLQEREAVVLIKFEYVYKAVAREHYNNGKYILEQHRRESFIYPELSKIDHHNLRPHERYARLMRRYGIDYEMNDGIDMYFVGLLRQEQAELAKVLDHPELPAAV